MEFAYTILYVPDVVRAIEFYERAFGFQRGFVHESGEYGELQTGQTTLSFASLTLANSNFAGGVTPSDQQRPPAAFEVAFSTDDVEAAFARATTAGAIPVSPPKQKPWGQTVAYVRDLNGNPSVFLSLAPGFSRVNEGVEAGEPFQRLSTPAEAVETALPPSSKPHRAEARC